jgi:hypothetical protein
VSALVSDEEDEHPAMERAIAAADIPAIIFFKLKCFIKKVLL